MSNNSKQTIYIYVGIEKSKAHSNKMNVSVLLDGKHTKPLLLPVIPITFKTETEYMNMYHYATLYALKYTLSQLPTENASQYNLCFYPNNELIYKEYNNDYLKNCKFKKGTADVSLWNEILNLIQSHNISLEIKSKSSILSGLGNIEKRGRKNG